MDNFRKAAFFIGGLLQACILAVIVFILVAMLDWRPPPLPQTVWHSKSPDPPPGDFRVMMFPVNDSVTYTAPSGSKDTLDRAMANSLDELNQAEITLRLQDGTTALVSRQDLILTTSPDRMAELSKRWKNSIADRSPEILRGQTSVAHEKTPGGEDEFLICLADVDETRIWNYSTDGMRVTPLRYSYLNRMDKALAFANRLPMYFGISLTAGGLLLVYHLRKRSKTHQSDPSANPASSSPQ